jgi:hypothetical protein
MLLKDANDAAIVSSLSIWMILRATGAARMGIAGTVKIVGEP